MKSTANESLYLLNPGQGSIQQIVKVTVVDFFCTEFVINLVIFTVILFELMSTYEFLQLHYFSIAILHYRIAIRLHLF